jgi:hypothetical protein
MVLQTAQPAGGSDPAWLTLGIALLALVGTVATALVALRAARATKEAAESAADASVSAAKAAADASRFVAGSDRFADWQMHKRTVYAELLTAMRAAATQPDSLGAALACFDVALLNAYPATRPYLERLREGFAHASPPGELDHAAYVELIRVLNEDIGMTPRAAEEANAAEERRGRV